MKRSASSIVLIVDIHVLQSDEVVQRAWLVSLGRHVEYISTVYVLHSEVSAHFLDHYTDQLNVTVIGREVQCGESLICRHVGPLLSRSASLNHVFTFLNGSFAHIFGRLSACQVITKSVLIDQLEAEQVVFEC